MDMLLAPHFRLSEFTRSQTAVRFSIDNTPSPEAVENLRRLCVAVLEPLRIVVGPLYVSSGYRSPRLNARIGGSAHSQHMIGCAADVVHGSLDPRALCELIIDLHLPFDQLIHEGTWTHVSVQHPAAGRRGQVLTAIFSSGAVRYVEGIG